MSDPPMSQTESVVILDFTDEPPAVGIEKKSPSCP
jgi:hypothetical protein